MRRGLFIFAGDNNAPMASLGDLKRRYDEMDPVQRQNFWFVVVGVILAIILFISLSNTADMLNGFLGMGAKAAGDNLADVQGLVK